MRTITIPLDTLRRDHLGCYGNRRVKMPSLDAFAERAVVFDRAYVGSYPCMPPATSGLRSAATARCRSDGA